MKRPYQKHFRVAYHSSTRKVYITIPDDIHFPSDMAWVWIKDTKTVMMAIDKPAHTPAAEHVKLCRQDTLPGCRYCYLGPVTHGLGEPFRVACVGYKKAERKSLAYEILIPDEEDRLTPKGRAPAEPVKTFQLLPEGVEEETERVTIEGFGSSWRYELTIDEVLELTAYASKLNHSDT